MVTVTVRAKRGEDNPEQLVLKIRDSDTATQLIDYVLSQCIASKNR